MYFSYETLAVEVVLDSYWHVRYSFEKGRACFVYLIQLHCYHSSDTYCTSYTVHVSMFKYKIPPSCKKHSDHLYRNLNLVFMYSH